MTTKHKLSVIVLKNAMTIIVAFYFEKIKQTHQLRLPVTAKAKKQLLLQLKLQNSQQSGSIISNNLQQIPGESLQLLDWRGDARPALKIELPDKCATKCECPHCKLCQGNTKDNYKNNSEECVVLQRPSLVWSLFATNIIIKYYGYLARQSCRKSNLRPKRNDSGEKCPYKL